MSGAKGHIFNLGHGIMPQAKLECVEELVNTVVNWKS
jgi:uroporphyrinogen decarboxylase